MNLFLDTHVLLLWLEDPNLLREEVIDAIADPDNDVLVSSAVVWEISIKRGIGKLDSPDDLELVLPACGSKELPITHEHGLATEQLPFHHRDPFDRILIAQALCEGGVTVTRDPSSRGIPRRRLKPEQTCQPFQNPSTRSSDAT